MSGLRNEVNDPILTSLLRFKFSTSPTGRQCQFTGKSYDNPCNDANHAVGRMRVLRRGERKTAISVFLREQSSWRGVPSSNENGLKIDPVAHHRSQTGFLDFCDELVG